MRTCPDGFPGPRWRVTVPVVGLPCMSALATELPEALEVEAGDEVVVPVHLRNTGTVVDEFTVSVVGEPEAWAIVEPPMIALFPNTETVVNVRLRPPRTSSTAPGVVPFAIMVSSAESPEESFAEEGFLTIAPFYETDAELAPVDRRGWRLTAVVGDRGSEGLARHAGRHDPDQQQLGVVGHGGCQPRQQQRCRYDDRGRVGGSRVVDDLVARAGRDRR